MDSCPKHGTSKDNCWDCCEEHWRDWIGGEAERLQSQLTATTERLERVRALAGEVVESEDSHYQTSGPTSVIVSKCKYDALAKELDKQEGE